ncbi:hypothetical protein [Halorubellus sp. PRR65]|uniref:hypothetical protein n=1 Tax=Halorubellus sp. PRR65 TaxID=3098148 RepID=UPI002B25C566|nr:hypothetical protein [Halorubellus sp. PRR65]
MTTHGLHVGDTHIIPGTILRHAQLGVVQVTQITPGHDGDPRIEIQPTETDARDWFILTHTALRQAWGDTITPTPDSQTPTTATMHEGVRNQPWADGGRVVDDDHECLPATDQTTDQLRCRLCGQLLDQ